MRNTLAALTTLLLAGAIILGWWWPNRAEDPAAAVHVQKFNSLSYAGYRAWESPLTDNFPTQQEVDDDLALLAPTTRAIRTYAAIEGTYDVAALAQKHGLKVWQGIWLGGDRAHNAVEMARGIALAHLYPDTIERVVVGNEVLLRRDLPVDELIADIDQVKAAVRQPVAYADVSDFWEQFPQVAPHVDVVLIHLLPYWEDTPTGIDHAVGYVGQVYDRLHALFPQQKIAIGETGWPSRGRQRADALPGRVNEARFLREFIALSEEKGFDYNFIEAFDQDWKYESEGIVGANWGIFRADRTPKIPLQGPLEADPRWPVHAGFSLVCGMMLSALGFAAGAGRRVLLLCVVGMVLGAAVGVAQAGVEGVLYDVHVRLAAVVNIGGQALLAGLMMLRVAGVLAPCPERTGADATRTVQALLRGRRPELAGAFEDVFFVFLWTAAVLQMLLVFDPRYREFPLSSFAVPLVVAGARVVLRERRQAGGVEALFVGLVLAGGAVASLVQEGFLNGQSLVWNCCALLLSGYALSARGVWRLPAPHAASLHAGYGD
jgi:exo-beta-1,3-glucanase (GH17 family)